MAYVIGIDGGGTKTIALFSKIEGDFKLGQSNQSVTGEGINPQLIGFDEMKHRLKGLIQKGLAEFSVSTKDIAGLCVGLAGVRSVEDKLKLKQQLQAIVSELKFSQNTVISSCSDVYIALRGALKPDEKEGILVISGTGSNGIGISKQGEVYRTGGWGHVLGDEGSGYYIGLRALHRVCKAHDLRDRNTVLTSMILKQLDLKNENQLIPYIYRTNPDKKVIAGLAKQVVEASKQGDKTAIEILEEAANELVLHVESLFRQCGDFNEGTPITTAGSVFEHARLLKDLFYKNLETKKLGCYREAYSTPATGAVFEAKNLLVNQSKKAGWLY